MAYPRTRPREDADAQRDRARGQRSLESRDRLHDTRTSPLRASGAGGRRAAGAEVGSVTAPGAPAPRAEAFRMAFANQSGLMRLARVYPDGTAEALGQATVPTPDSRAANVAGMASLGQNTIGVLNSLHREVRRYSLSTNSFLSSPLTSVPLSAVGMTANTGPLFSAHSAASRVYIVYNVFSPSESVIASTAVARGDFRRSTSPPSHAYMMLDSRNDRSSGLARDPATGTLYVTDVGDARIYAYSAAAQAGSPGQAATNGFRTATALNDGTQVAPPLSHTSATGVLSLASGNTRPEAIVYAERTVDSTTHKRLYVADSAARKIFAYEPRATSASHMASEDLAYGDLGLDSSDVVRGLVAAPTS